VLDLERHPDAATAPIAAAFMMAPAITVAMAPAITVSLEGLPGARVERPLLKLNPRAGTLGFPMALLRKQKDAMAVNKPTGDNARKGAVRKRSQVKTKVMGEDRYTKRDKTIGQFMDQKEDGKKFKGVRKEK
jgi:hypothetical protein